jgi:hypothetical protein
MRQSRLFFVISLSVVKNVKNMNKTHQASFLRTKRSPVLEFFVTIVTKNSNTGQKGAPK